MKSIEKMIPSISNKRIYLFLAVFLIISSSIAYSQVDVKVKLPKLKNRIKLERGNKTTKPTEEESTPLSNSETTGSTSKEEKARPQCADNSEQKVIRFRTKLDDMEARLDAEFSTNSFQISLSSLERDYKSVKNSLTNCRTTNPNYDFSNDQQNIENALADYDLFYANYEVKSKEGDRHEEVRYLIQSCASGMNYYPGYSFGEDLLALNKEDIAPFINQQEETSTRSRGHGDIKSIETIINSSDFVEKTYSFLDGRYGDSDKENGIKEIQVKIRDLGHLESVFFPENANLTEVLAYAKKLESKLVSSQNQGLKEIAVSDFHLSNMNSIKFTSNANLDPKLATESDFKTEFEAGEQIKAIAYLDQRAEKHGTIYYLPEFKLKSASNSNRFTVEGYQSNHGALGYIEFYISLDAVNYTATEGAACEAAISMDFLGELPPRKHSIEVTLQGGKEPMAILTFNADNDEGLKKMADQKVLIRDKHLANVPLPKAKMKNATYEGQLVKMFNSIGWEETFKKAIITSSDWGYEKNYAGIVIGRTLSVVMVSSKNEGCMYQEFTVIQDKVGSQYSEFKIHGTGGQNDISCSKVH